MQTRTRGMRNTRNTPPLAATWQIDGSEALALIAACAVIIRNQPADLAALFPVIESAALKFRRATGMTDQAWQELLDDSSPDTDPNPVLGQISAFPVADAITPIGERVFHTGVGYQIIEHMGTGAKGIRCRTCKRTSWHPTDVLELYCAGCHWFHSETRPTTAEPCERPAEGRGGP